jgi:thiol-disulfide isomerase/thioredoxin
MKYLFMNLLLAFYITAGAQQTTAKPFTLSGEITGVQEGKLYLGYTDGDGKRVSDSTMLSNGRFRFTGKITEPVMAYMSYNTKRASIDDPNTISFFIDPANMKMTMAFNAFKDAVITGGPTQTEYAVLQKQQQKFRKRWQVVMDTLSAINKRSNALYQETRAWALSPYTEEYRELTATFIQEHPASYVTAWLLRFERDISTDSLKKLYARFPQPVKQSSFGREVAKDLEKRKTGIPGVKAALFTSTGIDGQPVSLADLKGKYVLVDFWASWCVPCRKGNPHLKELYARYKEKGFEVIGVSDDDSKPEAWKKAVEQDGLPWKHVLRGLKVTRNGDAINIDHTNDISEGYNIHSLPTQVLIGPDGMIIGRYGDSLGEDHAALDKKLEEIFK